MWELLKSIETALHTIPELKTVKIGAETGINTKDCPAARIITEYSMPNERNPYFDNGAIQILLLLDLKNDLPSVYEDSIALEVKIRKALETIISFNRIDYDADAVTVYKASILRYTYAGLKNGLKECSI